MKTKKEFEKDLERLFTWKEIYDEFGLGYLNVGDRYVISWFISKVGAELRKLGYKIEYHNGVACKCIEEEIKKKKDKEELEMYRKKYGK